MRRTCAFVAMLILLPLCAPRSLAHEGCSIRTITGTWGFGAFGKSLIGSAEPNDMSHLEGAYLPGAFAGRVTIRRNGTFDGYYWINIAGGLYVSGSTPIPFGGPVKVDPDCTGEWSYPVVLPDGSEETVVERFVILDQGREIRSISWTTGIPTFTWTLVAKRIPRRCTQRLVQGAWGMQCHGHSAVPGLGPDLPDPALFSTANLFRFGVGADGAAAGRFMEKIGPLNIDVPFTGSFTMAADCSVAAEFDLPGLGVARSVAIAVEDTREGFGIPMFLQPAEPPAPNAGDDGMVPLQAVYCEFARVTPARACRAGNHDR